MKSMVSFAIAALLLAGVTFSEAGFPGLSVTKSASPSMISAAGQTITYSFVVTNTGDETLTNITVNETFSGSGAPPGISCSETFLPVGGQITCTGTYTATQTDTNVGVITNTATASGTTLGGSPVTITSDSSAATVHISLKVPTFSRHGFIILSLALVGLGLIALRRRKLNI